MMSNFLMSSDFIFRKYSRSSLKIFSRKTVWCWAVGPTPTPWRLIGRTITCKKSDNFALIDKLVIYSLCRQLSIRNNDYKKTRGLFQAGARGGKNRFLFGMRFVSFVDQISGVLPDIFWWWLVERFARHSTVLKKQICLGWNFTIQTKLLYLYWYYKYGCRYMIWLIK